jgi:hypothetical protein
MEQPKSTKVLTPGTSQFFFSSNAPEAEVALFNLGGIHEHVTLVSSDVPTMYLHGTWYHVIYFVFFSKSMVFFYCFIVHIFWANGPTIL